MGSPLTSWLLEGGRKPNNTGEVYVYMGEHVKLYTSSNLFALMVMQFEIVNVLKYKVPSKSQGRNSSDYSD